MPAKNTTDESPKPSARSKKREPEAPAAEPLLKDRRFVGAVTFLAAVAIFAAGYLVGHAVGEDDVSATGGPVTVDDRGRGFIGVVVEGEDGGARIVAVLPGSPADRTGLRPRDVVVAVGDREISSMEALADVVRQTRPGTVIELTVLRGDELHRFRVGVVRRPSGRFPPRPGG